MQWCHLFILAKDQSSLFVEINSKGYLKLMRLEQIMLIAATNGSVALYDDWLASPQKISQPFGSQLFSL